MSKPPPAAALTFRNSRLLKPCDGIIWHLSPIRRHDESPCEYVGTCRNGKCFPSSPVRYLHPSVGAFRAARLQRSSVVRIGSSHIEARRLQSRRAARDGSGRWRGLLLLSLPCRLPSTLALRRSVPPHR